MKRIVLLLFGLSLLGSPKAQDTIPFLDPSLGHQLVQETLPPYTLYPLDTLLNYYPLLFLSNYFNLQRFEYYIYNRYKIPDGTNVYGFAITADSCSIAEATGSLFTYSDNGGFVYYDSIYTNGNSYRKKMFYEIDTFGVVPCYIFLFEDRVSININTNDTTFYVKLDALNRIGDGCSIYFVGRDEIGDSYPLPNELSFASFDSIDGFLGPTTCGAGGGIYPVYQLPCPAPRVRMGNNYSGRVEFHWNPGGDTALYQLSFYSADDGRLMFETDTLTDTNFVLVDSMVPADMVNGRYEVRARKACDYLESPYHTLVWSEWSEPRAFNYMHRVEGIGEVDAMADFRLSPNPARGTVTVEIDQERLQGAFLQIVNLEGHIVAESIVKGPMFDLDISALPTGVYLVRVGTTDGTATRKLVITTD